MRLITCTVYEPPNPPADRMDRAEALVFVRDGFSLAAALLTPFWLLARALWLPLLAFLALASVTVLIVFTLGFASLWASLLIAALQLVIGFESGSLERFRLERKGWTMIGAVTGTGVIDCERRFFESWLPRQPVIAMGAPGAPPPLRRETRREGWGSFLRRPATARS